MYEAPPSAEGAPVAVDTTNIPTVFPLPVPNGAPICGVCSVPVPKKTDCRDFRGVRCEVCSVWWHWKCVNLRHPPRFGWACDGCHKAMEQ